MPAQLESHEKISLNEISRNSQDSGSLSQLYSLPVVGWTDGGSKQLLLFPRSSTIDFRSSREKLRLVKSTGRSGQRKCRCSFPLPVRTAGVSSSSGQSGRKQKSNVRRLMKANGRVSEADSNGASPATCWNDFEIMSRMYYDLWRTLMFLLPTTRVKMISG